LPVGNGTYYRLSEREWRSWAPKANISLRGLINQFEPANEIYCPEQDK
jgi:hypothetical protein